MKGEPMPVFGVGNVPLCGATTDTRPTREGPWVVHCTLPTGHDGRHIATIGPYEPGAHILATWEQETP